MLALPTLEFKLMYVVLDCTRQVYNLGNGGVPVHHDPVDGIFANHEK
jgi:hypothetical protein